MKRLLLLFVLASPFIAGCTTVSSPRPVGDAPMLLEESEWEGSWTGSGDFLQIRIIEAEKGQLEVAWIETDADGFGLERVEVFLRSSGDGAILSARDLETGTEEGLERGEADEGEEDAYALFRFAREEDQIFLWWPEVEAFKRLVESGELPGTVSEGGDVELGELSSTHNALLTSEEGLGLWKWTEPIALHRASSGGI